MTNDRTRQQRWYVTAFLIAGLAGAFALWVFSSSQGGTEIAAFGGVYSEASVGTPLRVNPLFAGQNSVDDDLSALVFAGLTRVGRDGRVLPSLAESWQTSDDGTEYTFKLRDGLIWHDGHDLTADDVVFTWAVLSSTEFSGDAQLGAFWRTVIAQRVDDLTVRYQLEEPFSPFLAQTAIGILPAHLLAATPVAELATSPFNSDPVGAGPYRLTDLTPRSASLEANYSFHLGPPLISRINFTYFPNEAAALASLAQGEVDGFYTSGTVGRDQVDSLRANHTVSELVSNSYTMLYLNWQVPALRDDAVRRAIVFAIDRQSIVQGILGGRGVLSDGVIAPQTWAWADDLQAYSHDPDRAASILDDAGWELGPDGVREKGDDLLSFELVTNTDSTRTAIASQVAESLQRVGIGITVSATGGSALYEQVLQPHNFELALFGFAPGVDPDPFPAWHGSQASGGANIAAFANEQVDEGLAEARVSPALDRRAELYLDFQQTFYELQPSIALFFPTNLYFLPRELQAFEPVVSFSSASRFADVWRWYIETREVKG